MEKQNDSVRDRLLARLPQPENLAAYREEVASGLAKNEKKLSWVKWMARSTWLVLIVYWAVVFNRGETWLATPNGHVFTFVVVFLFICGFFQILKYFVLRSRVEILREVKQVQLQVLELQASLQKTSE
ncbi:MAG: hypothetical protein WCA89_00515 [Terracidiphilus sp.]|jgi:hypothetical protein